MKKPFTFVLLALGFTAIVSQFVLIRELLVVFYGNELAIGIMLACWLFWVAVGSWFFGRFTGRAVKPTLIYASCSFLTFLWLAVEVWLLRLIHPLLGFKIGEIVGLPTIFLTAFAVLMPLATLLGFQFALAVQIYSKNASDIGYAYVCESIGSLIGGLLFSFLLIYWLEPFQIVCLIGVANLSVAVWLLLHWLDPKPLFSALVVLIWLAAAALLIPGGRIIERKLVKMAWQGREVVFAGNSIYGNLVVTRLKSQYSFFENGLLMFTSPEALGREETVHYALLAHPRPAKVLLIGGGIGGPLREILKHPVSQVDYVELDPLVVRTGKKFVSREDLEAFQNPKVNTHYLDGRLFVQTTGEKFDVVILNLPDPYNGLLNRFYTAQFFAEVRRILKSDGLFSLGISSSEEYIGPEMRSFDQSIYQTLKSVFSRIALVPGERAFFLASSGDNVSQEAAVYIDRLQSRQIDNIYVREAYLNYKLNPQRVGYLQEQLEKKGKVRFNHDFFPVSYYYDAVLWSAQFTPRFAVFFQFLDRSRNWWLGLLGLFFLITQAFLWTFRRSEKSERSLILMAVAVAGLTGMALEILLIASFQALYGYVYARLSLIITAFMAGLALGGWTMSRYLDKVENISKTLSLTLLALAVISVKTPFLMSFFVRMSSGLHLSQSLIFLLMVMVGGLVGAVFPLAAKILYLERPDSGRAGGTVLGADLVGAALGALLISALVFPLTGLGVTCYVLTFLCLTSFAFLWIS